MIKKICRTFLLCIICSAVHSQEVKNLEDKRFKYFNYCSLEGNLILSKIGIYDGGFESSIDLVSFSTKRWDFSLNTGFYFKIKYPDILDPMYVGYKPKTLFYTYLPIALSGDYNLHTKKSIFLRATLGIPTFVREGSNVIGLNGFWASYSDALESQAEYRKKISVILKMQLCFPMFKKFESIIGAKAYIFDSTLKNNKFILGLNYGISYKFDNSN